MPYGTARQNRGRNDDTRVFARFIMADRDSSEEQNVGEEIIRGLKELRDALRDEVSLDERFKVDHLEQPPCPAPTDSNAT